MPVTEGNLAGQFIGTVRHVSNGEKANEITLRRPSVDLENRTDALHEFANSEELRLTGVSDKATNNVTRITTLEETSNTAGQTMSDHASDLTQHTTFATEIETKAGAETAKVISPALLKAAMTEAFGSQYDAVVGAAGKVGVNYTSITDAVLAAQDGWRILVTIDQAIDAALDVVRDRLEIEFKNGVSLTAGAATNGLNISGDYCKVKNARLVGFSGSAIIVGATASFARLRDLNFKSCVNTVTNNADTTSELGSVEE